ITLTDMKKVLFTISVLIIVSCNKNVSDSKIVIKAKSDTIKIDNVFEAELSVEYADSILPDFNILSRGDTFLLPFDELRRCAVFKAVGRKSGDNTYIGYASYRSRDGVLRKDVFEITFFVEE
ncbi:MAG: hypothetical protein ABR519_05190, partial [Bacteroidales bacterium]